MIGVEQQRFVELLDENIEALARKRLVVALLVERADLVARGVTVEELHDGNGAGRKRHRLRDAGWIAQREEWLRAVEDGERLEWAEAGTLGAGRGAGLVGAHERIIEPSLWYG